MRFVPADTADYGPEAMDWALSQYGVVQPRRMPDAKRVLYLLLCIVTLGIPVILGIVAELDSSIAHAGHCFDGSSSYYSGCPSTPTQLSPPDGGNVTSPVQFGARFEGAEAPTSTSGYHSIWYEVCSDAACATPIWSKNFCDTTFVPPGCAPGDEQTLPVSESPALANGTYYWRIYAIDGNVGVTGNSPIWSFVVGPGSNTDPDEPTLSTPFNLSSTTDRSPPLVAEFEDSDAGDTGTIHFEVCDVATIAGQTCVAAGGTVQASGSSASGVAIGTSGSWDVTPDLSPGVYHWHAYGEDDSGATGPWTATWQLAIDVASPSGLFTDDTDASAGSTQPTGIINDDHHYSWVNNAGEAVDRQRVQVVNTPLDDVVGLWHFDDAADPTADSSGNGFDADLQTAPNDPAYVGGQAGFGQALNFDGDDWTDVAHNPALAVDTYTAEAWIRTTASGGGSVMPILSKRDLGRNVWLTVESSGFAHADVALADVTGSTFVADGEWHHVAVVVDSGPADPNKTIEIYVDGQLDGGTASATFGGDILNDLLPLKIGGDDPNGEYFDGDIDDVRFSSVPRSAAEIAGYYESKAPHYAVVWDSDTGDTGVAIGASCADGVRCNDVVFGATGTPADLAFGGTRYYARAKFRTQSGGLWSDWSTWDWFETASTTAIDVTGCQTGTPEVTDFGSVIGGTSVVTGTDCAIDFGSSGASTMLRVYQQDGGGSAASSKMDGSLDSSWGTAGVEADFAGPTDETDNIWGEGVVTDGDILVQAGHVDYGGTSDIFVSKRLADGSRDPTFNGGSDVIIDIDDLDWMASTHVAPDGKILVSGVALDACWCAAQSAFVVRLLPGGGLDPSFDGDPSMASYPGNGVVRFNVGGLNTWDFATSVAMTDSQHIVLGGTGFVGASGNNDAWAVMLKPDGSYETNFNGTGSRAFDVGGDNDASLYVTEAQQIMLGWVEGGVGRVLMARMELDGSLDASFDGPAGDPLYPGNGLVEYVIDTDSHVLNFHERGDGTMWMTGQARVTAACCSDAVFAMRVLADGEYDTSFSGNGKYIHDFGGSHTSRTSLPTPQGGVILASGFDDATEIRTGMLALDSVGNTDTGYFAGGSIVIDSMMPGDEAIGYMGWGQDGRIIATGVGEDGGAEQDWFSTRFDTIVVNDYQDGVTDWDQGLDMFAGCLRSVAGGATDDTDTWTVDPGNDCASTDADEWNPIAPSQSDPGAKVAETTGAGFANASADLRFGVRSNPATPADTAFQAVMIIEAVSPNL